MTASVAQRVVKCAGMLFRVCVRVPSETDDRDRECIYSLISDLNSVRWFLHVTSCNATSTTLVWDGPSMVIDGPSLIESFDSCVSMKLSSTI